jgi:hypothetical protein
MKKFIIILSVWSINSFAQTKPAHISIVQGVSSEGIESKNYDYHFSFNLFSGTVKSVKGVEIGSIYNQNEGNMTGFQVSGLLNITKGNVNGYQSAGLTNISGLVNGLQEAGLTNHSKNLTGVQISGITNFAEIVKGVQLTGIYNQAQVLKGYQIGLINVADSVVKGGGIGLINLYKKGGYREIEFSVADYQNIGLSFKSGTRTLYFILNIGYNYNPVSLFSNGFGIGRIAEFKKNWYFKPEFVFYSYVSDDFKFKNTTNSTHLKFGIMRKVKNIGFTISPSIYYADIPNGLDKNLSQISRIKPFSNTNNSRWGYGVNFGIAFLKY